MPFEEELIDVNEEHDENVFFSITILVDCSDCFVQASLFLAKRSKVTIEEIIIGDYEQRH